MPPDPPRSYEELSQQASWPLSRLYHQHSKLGEHKRLEFQEEITAYSDDYQAIRESSRAYKAYPTQPHVELPPPRARFRSRRLTEVLQTRRTRRSEFTAQQVTLRQWGHLFGVAGGITGQVTHPEIPDLVQPLRAWPSGGALYPLEMYLAVLRGDDLERAVYHYETESHQLARVAACPEDGQWRQIVLADGLWENACGLLILTAIFARTQVKYGERGYRFLLLDAGHLAQNVVLVCEDLGLAAIPLGGFQDDALADTLGLNSQQESPVYAILIGRV